MITLYLNFAYLFTQILKVGVRIKKLILSIDIDNDFISTPRNVKELSWNGLNYGLPLLLKSIDNLAIELKKIFKITIFCRADWQIKTMMGSSTWVFEKTREVIDKPNLQGTLIDYQWHPHLYTFKNDIWSFTLDSTEQCQQLEETYSDLFSAGLNISCSRIGECFFSDTILCTLEQLNIAVDSTALPGRDLGYVDWTSAQRSIFYPQVSVEGTITKSTLLEVPFSMISILAPYDEIARERYLNIIYQNKYVSKAIKNYSGEYIVTIAHPYEILPLLGNEKHQLLGDEQSAVKNIQQIINSHDPQSLFLKELYSE
jgi:hypothetical protein